MLDKMIHQKEFRLRIMLTDFCNMSCENCLNEFQPKGVMYKNANYASPGKVMILIRDYVSFCEGMNIKPVVSFTGGEPGFHPYFIQIIDYAKKFKNLKIQVNTNGIVDNLYWDRNGVDIRYHVGPDLLNPIMEGQTAVFVVKEPSTINEVIDFLTPFHLGGMKIKTFADFHSREHFLDTIYPYMIEEINKCFPVSGRFTGKQINRGDGCYNCEKRCITLKALWMFPDNTYSPCPQRRLFFKKILTPETMFSAYNFHLA